MQRYVKIIMQKLLPQSPSFSKTKLDCCTMTATAYTPGAGCILQATTEITYRSNCNILYNISLWTDCLLFYRENGLP